MQTANTIARPLLLKTGDLAFYDSLTAGLVPCRVLSITGKPHSSIVATSAHRVRVKLTATRRPFERGEEIETSSHHVAPRDAVRGLRSHSPRIMPYAVTPDHKIETRAERHARLAKEAIGF